MIFYRMSKIPKTFDGGDTYVKLAQSSDGSHNLLVDEELVRFFPNLEKPLCIVPFKGRLLSSHMLKESEVLVVRSVTSVCEELLDGSRIKLVCSTTSGLDHIDKEYLRRSNIELTNAPGANAIAVVEYVIFTILLYSLDTGKPFQNLKIGVIGHGEIGSRLTKLLEELGLHVLVNDPPKKKFQKLNREHFSLEQLVSECDCLTVHVPLDNETEYPTINLLDYELLKGIKDEALIINSSRGNILKESDLLVLLKKKPAVKVALDCWINEPKIDASLARKIWQSTPHIAGATLESKIRAVQKIMPAINNYFGVANNDIVSNKKNNLDKIEIKTIDLDFKKIVDVVLPLKNISENFKRKSKQNISKLLPEDFDDLRTSSLGRRELSYYRFSENQVVLNKIKRLLTEIA